MSNAENDICNLFIQPDLRRGRIAVSADAPDGATLRHAVLHSEEHAEGPPEKTLIELAKREPWPTNLEISTLRTECIVDGDVSSSIETKFAIREATLREGKLFLNGRPLQLRMVDYDPASEFQADLKSAHDVGFNAVRIPALGLSSGVVQTAAELGLLVMVRFEFGISVDDIIKHIRQWRNAIPVVAWMIDTVAKDGSRSHVPDWANNTLSRIHETDPSRIAITLAPHGRCAMWRPYRDAIEPYRYLSPAPSATTSPDVIRQIVRRHTEAPFIIDSISAGSAPRAVEELKQATSSENTWADAPTDWAKAAFEAQAQNAAHLIRATRGNTASVGYVYTALRDTDGANNGLIDASGKAKPALAAVKAAQAPLAIELRGEQSALAPREEMKLSLHVLSDKRNEEQAQLSIQVIGPTGQVLWKKMRAIRIGKSRKPLWEGRIAGSGKTGAHSVVARLKIGGRIAAEGRYPFAVIEHPEKPAARVSLIDPEGVYRQALARYCSLADGVADVHVVPPLANTVRAYPADAIANALGQTREGSAMLIFAPPADWNDLADRVDPALKIDQRGPLALAKGECGIASLHPVFDGLPAKCILTAPHAGIAEGRVFRGATDDAIQVYAERGDKGATEAAHGIVVRRYGSGRIIFVAAPIAHRVGSDPAAERYFVNLIAYAARRSVPPESEVPLNAYALAWLSSAFEDLSRWRIRKATDAESAFETCPEFANEQRSRDIASWYLRGARGEISLDACLADIEGGEAVILESRAVLDRRETARIQIRFTGECVLWVNGRLAEFEEAEDGAVRTAPLNLNTGRNTITLGLRITLPDTAPEITIDINDDKPLKGVRWR